ncbi:hypothetical protein HMPREF1986_02885 [Oribacterium sp. oral taxon 078 str. F0263]|nr:hypothetical protein HMPREF1986_02885 [Oribacterium sp. oral taxon 078 str. F0263]
MRVGAEIPRWDCAGPLRQKSVLRRGPFCRTALIWTALILAISAQRSESVFRGSLRRRRGETCGALFRKRSELSRKDFKAPGKGVRGEE